MAEPQRQKYTDSCGELWHIEYNPKPVPIRGIDWEYTHDDYDGAPDADDYRYGSAATPELCRADIEVGIADGEWG